MNADVCDIYVARSRVRDCCRTLLCRYGGPEMNNRDFSTRLAAEVKQWVLDGIIDWDTAARVVSRYP
jgi:hypothetical protein